VTDRYTVPATTCLENKLGVSDPVQLRDIEAQVVSVRDVELARTVVPGEYNLAHLQEFHRHLFQDVYSWAGQLRTVDISKDGIRFGNWQFIGEQLSAVLAELETENWLTGLQKHRFVERLSFSYGEINALHPFREGNGRAKRAFLRQLSASAGWRLDWSELSRAANIEASRHSMVTATTDKLIDVLTPVVTRI
jgi:cell filamentation protein